MRIFFSSEGMMITDIFNAMDLGIKLPGFFNIFSKVTRFEYFLERKIMAFK